MASSVDLKNVQGDILSGLAKKAEAFFFFKIVNVEDFRKHLHKLLPLISSSEKVVSERERIEQHRRSQSGLLPVHFANIAFSSKGLKSLGVTDDIKDGGFAAGMLADAEALGDEGTSSSGKFDPDWSPEFKKEIDGVILGAAQNRRAVEQHLGELLKILHHSIEEIFNIIGHVRPGKEDGHEQLVVAPFIELANDSSFGFQDGISNPAVNGFDKELPGEGLIDPGVVLLGRNGDPIQRPSWALDGSFLAFRLLDQLVPEFEKFLIENALQINDPSASGSELLGARLVGRWKSGAPIDVTPLQDDPVLAADPQRNNDFQYDKASQERCPFAAHTRKMNPRSDLGETVVDPHRIIRRGIQFGPEVSHDEAASHKTTEERGLLFVSYQSNLAQGFQFLQKNWANITQFPPQKPQVPGFDPIIGQAVGGDNSGARTMSGANPDSVATSLDLGFQRWVVPKGGEYFFSPSISTLRDVLAANEVKTEL